MGRLRSEVNDSIVWFGEILEVDETTGRIFIVVNNPEYPPRRGSFYVRPFEFWAFPMTCITHRRLSLFVNTCLNV